jgi:hypothetical protein
MADILHSIQISDSADAIYPLISTAQGLAQWRAADVTENGGAVELGFFNRQTVYRLRAQVNQRPSHFEWACETRKEWAGTRLIFKLEPAGSGTLVRFTHAGWQSATDYFVACTTTWGELMFRLKSVAEGKSRGPLFLPSSLAY